MVTKTELRRNVRQMKKTYTQEQMREMSEAVCGTVLSLDVWKTAATVLLYYPLPDEADIRHLIYIAEDSGKTVLLPRVVGEDLELRIYHGEDSLQPGAFHILEPVSEVFPVSRYGEIDLAVVPGMAFTHSGARLGRGKGFYDRLLPKIKNAERVGVCLPFQLLEDIPTEPHDIVMDKVVA